MSSYVRTQLTEFNDGGFVSPTTSSPFPCHSHRRNGSRIFTQPLAIILGYPCVHAEQVIGKDHL